MFKKKNYADEDLIRAVQSGGRMEDDAIAYLIRRDFQKISYLITKRNGSVEDAEDIFQEALAVLLYNIKRGVFKGESAISTYIYSICKGMWYKRFKKYVREKEHSSSMIIEDRDENTPEVQVLDEEQQQLMMTLFERLKSGCKELLLKWSMGDSMTDIAEALSLKNAQIAMNKKNKCLKELHDRIHEDPTIKALANALKGEENTLL